MAESLDESKHEDHAEGGKKRTSKKRLLLRIDPALHDDLRAWAEQDFRSINAQIEFILNQAVSKRKRGDK